MKTFVLVPGAWMGAWAWEPVARELRSRGHDVHVVALSGLDDPRADVSHVGVATHISEVRAEVESTASREVVLVCHGTSGVIAGTVAAEAADRVVHTVFIEALLPHTGRSALDAFQEPVRTGELQAIHDNGGRWPAPDTAAVGSGQGLSARQARWLASRLVDHPGRPLTEPIRMTRPLSALSATYVVCSLDHLGGRLSPDVERMRREELWRFRTLPTGVWPMLSGLDDLVALLEDAAAAPSRTDAPGATDTPSRADGPNRAEEVAVPRRSATRSRWESEVRLSRCPR